MKHDILDKTHLDTLNRAQEMLKEADEACKLARAGGIELPEMEKQCKDLAEKVVKIKAAFFPGG